MRAELVIQSVRNTGTGQVCMYITYNGLPMRKRHRRDMFEDTLDRAFNGSNDILQRDKMEMRAEKKNFKNLDLIRSERCSLPSDQ